MEHGGKRQGAGRPKGTTKPPTVPYYRRVTPKEKILLDEYLKKLRA